MNGARARMLGVAVAAASLGAGVGVIANAGAQAGHHATAAHYGYDHRGFGRALGGPAVEGTAVVADNGGYRTVSFNRGTVVSTDTSAGSITIDEIAPGASAAYNASKTIDVSGATVYNGGQSSTLGSLTKGERVTVLKTGSKTLVIAHPAGPWGDHSGSGSQEHSWRG